MRKLVLTVVALLALFAALRAFPEAVPAPAAGIQLHPGLVEISDRNSSVGLAFGLLEKTDGRTSLWNMMPLRLTYKSGDRTVSLALNGFSFLLRGGVSVGRPIRIEGPKTGDVLSIGGKVTVDSRVDGDVWTVGADVVLTPRAEVTGNVVALGGRVSAGARSVVRGSVSQMPEIKIPIIGVLGTEFSAQVLAFGRQFLGFILLGFALFLLCFYSTARSRSVYHSLGRTWRSSLVTLAASLVAVPLLVALLIVTVIGLFFLPLLAFVLAVLALHGFLLLCARLGGVLRRAPAEGGEGDALFLFTSGLLGLFLVKLPALVGIVLTLLRSEAAARAGQILQLVSLGLIAAGMIYGAGASLAHARMRASKPG